jgi:hypothetical protein
LKNKSDSTASQYQIESQAKCGAFALINCVFLEFFIATIIVVFVTLLLSSIKMSSFDYKVLITIFFLIAIDFCYCKGINE